MTESRLKKSLSAGGRETRASQDASRAPAEEKFVSAQERRKMWSDEWTQSALPKLPEMKGWHLCWLSTTNSYDSIDKAGEYVGFIACNEMLLCKIPMEVYQDLMLHMHHELPMDEADKIKLQVEQMQGQRDSSGRSLTQVEGDGYGNFDQNASSKVPVFQG